MKNYEITKERIQYLSGYNLCVKEHLQNWFPDAFKEELEVGKWYINKVLKECFIFLENNNFKRYGFDSHGWYSTNDTLYDKTTEYWTLATPKEIETTLINEAKKRGFVKGAKTKGLAMYGGNLSLDVCLQNNSGYSYCNIGNILYANLKKGENAVIFKNGQWAEIIKPTEVTLQQIADAFNIDVNNLKIIK